MTSHRNASHSKTRLECEGEYKTIGLLVKKNFSPSFSRTFPRNLVENFVDTDELFERVETLIGSEQRGASSKRAVNSEERAASGQPLSEQPDKLEREPGHREPVTRLSLTTRCLLTAAR